VREAHVVAEPAACSLPGSPALLDVRGLRASYGALPVLHGLDLQVGAGEIVALLGVNGAGKTTLLRAIGGAVAATGSVKFAGRPILGLAPEESVRRGIAHVPQGRGTLPGLSVEDNLRAGAIIRRDRQVRDDIARAYEHFPKLAARRRSAAGRLSGGEQQMLALARAMLSRPRLLLLDEPSLGLAPITVRDVLERLRTLVSETGTALLLVEQNVRLALAMAGRGYVLEAGRIVATGSPAELADDPALRRAYLGS
jgi:branched-chain amino acid transport system ATP-binding protein